MYNDFKSVILRDKITDNLIAKIKDTKIWYQICDAGLDGVFEKGNYSWLCCFDSER